MLTRRIQARCADFSVEVLFQGAGRAAPDEGFLSGRRGRLSVVREVALKCGSTPVVYAHSIARLRDLRGPWRALATLGSRPLGAALFRNPRVLKHPLRFRRLNRHDAVHARARKALGTDLPSLWARRALYVLRGSPILVTEVFLPALLGR